jgi:soluble lytic murein transglycosylase-like protein
MFRPFLPIASATLALACLGGAAHAAEQVTLKNGFHLLCDHRATVGSSVRLYFDASGSNYMDVPASDIAATEHVSVPAADSAHPSAARPSAAKSQLPRAQRPTPARLSAAQLRPLLQRAGSAFDIDSDLLASVVRAESGGHTRAVSHAGAQGLMQLMPGTAAQLGVHNSFAPAQNVDGGAAYLDTLLIRYHDNLPLALAAYNAGPAAVDRWHGIPPYPETRAYVARVIHEYNRRYELRLRAAEGARRQLASVADRP